MNIPLRDLRPNPFRGVGCLGPGVEYVGSYPISRKDIEGLKASIRTTGFWDSLIVRKAPLVVDIKPPVAFSAAYQIAYGHRRLKALYELVDEHVLDLDYCLECPVRILDDSAMVRIMAADSFGERPEIVDHTIKAVREFVSKATKTPPKDLTADDLRMFMGSQWIAHEQAIKRSLKRIDA